MKVYVAKSGGHKITKDGGGDAHKMMDMMIK
jgi:hypothetical protein